MDEREELIRQLDASRQQMQALLDGIDPKLEIYPGWTKKEIIAHLTGWDDAVLQAVRSHLADQPPAVPAVFRGIDYYNEQSVVERGSLSYEQVLHEWTLARQQLKDLICAASSEKFTAPMVFPWGSTGTISQVILGMVVPHENDHVAEIRAILGK